MAQRSVGQEPHDLVPRDQGSKRRSDTMVASHPRLSKLTCIAHFVRRSGGSTEGRRHYVRCVALHRKVSCCFLEVNYEHFENNEMHYYENLRHQRIRTVGWCFNWTPMVNLTFESDSIYIESRMKGASGANLVVCTNSANLRADVVLTPGL